VINGTFYHICTWLHRPRLSGTGQDKTVTAPVLQTSDIYYEKAPVPTIRMHERRIRGCSPCQFPFFPSSSNLGSDQFRRMRKRADTALYHLRLYLFCGSSDDLCCIVLGGVWECFTICGAAWHKVTGSVWCGSTLTSPVTLCQTAPQMVKHFHTPPSTVPYGGRQPGYFLTPVRPLLWLGKEGRVRSGTSK